MDRKKTFAIVAVAALLITAALGATALAHQSNGTMPWQGMMGGQNGRMSQISGMQGGMAGHMDMGQMQEMHRQMHGQEMPEHCQQMMG